MVVEIPICEIDRIQLYINKNGKSLTTIMKETGADYGINGGIFSGKKILCNVKADGKVVNAPGWSEYGYAWNNGPDISMTMLPAPTQNYIGCVPLKIPGRAITPSYPSDMGGKRGRSAIGIKGDKLVLFCVSDGKEALTPEALQKALSDCDSVLMLDGGGSSQCDFKGKKIVSSRRVANVLLIYQKEVSKKPMSDKKKVVLDAGHDSYNTNQSPDGSYYEHEFALDIAKRMQAILTRHGVEVTMTRKTGESVSLSKRCQMANAIDGLDLFVSLHSNASGNGGWSSANGWCIYTSSANVKAGRNIAANAIIARIREAGITTRPTALVHDRFTVLTDTTAPAVLIEHGFHTNQAETKLLKDSAYRDKLSVAECKGILDYIGIAYDGQDEEEAIEEGNDPPASKWAEKAWNKAKEKGIFDGTDPQGNMTREMCAVVLDRLGLL